MWEELISSIKGFASPLLDFFSSFYDLLVNFYDWLMSVLGSIAWILASIWYWFTTLTSWILNIQFVEIFNNGALVKANQTLIDLWWLIWGPAVVFLCSIILLVIARVVVAFVFKILRLNLDYQTHKTTWNETQSRQKIEAFQKQHKEF